ncbi:MAG: cysteine hydrolase [Betaproteobacteria bacterium]|nr:cysteine hydrolase [Betaproteobacteria bacterium]
MYGIPQSVIDGVLARQGRLHTLTELAGERCALVVVDMQNYFVKPGFQAEIPAARGIVQAINSAARSTRKHGGTVVWIQTASDGADSDWSWLHHHLYSPERSKRRLIELAEGSEGFALWHEMQPMPQDLRIVKRRYSAFIQGSSNLDQELRRRGIDTVLIAGTATNVCCESTARDAMMLNFKTVMLADGNATMTEEVHVQTLANFMLFFGDVMSVAEMQSLFVATKEPA